MKLTTALSDVSEPTIAVPANIKKIKDFDLLLPLYISVIISPICLLTLRQAMHTANQRPSLKEIANVIATCYYLRRTDDNHLVHRIALTSAGYAAFAN